MARKPSSKSKSVDTLTHEGAKRTNIPTAEYESFLEDKDKAPIRLAYERRNRDLDPHVKVNLRALPPSIPATQGVVHLAAGQESSI